jgi:tetratricopeptide (TPR) repeat protein
MSAVRTRHLLLGAVLTAGFAAGLPASAGDVSPSPRPRIAQVAPGATTGNPYDAYMRLGYAASKRGDHEAAITYFRDALFYVPNDREATIAYWNERRALHNQQSPADRTPRETPYDRSMRLGYDETHSRDYQSALINFRRALAERPGDHFATQAVRNVTAYIAGEKGVSLPTLESASMSVATGHYTSESAYDRYMRLGYAAAKERRFTQAADYFRSALYERPNDRMATIAYWNQKHALNSSTSGSPARVDTATYERLMRLGYDATQRHHFSDALGHFQAALRVKPGDPYATQAVRNVSTYLQR